MKGKPVFFVGLLILLILLTLSIFSPNLTAAEIAPLTIPIQGKLTDLAGIPLNGFYNVVFSLYDLEAGGLALCSETRSVTVAGGLFSDSLGGNCWEQIKGQKVYLGVKVGDDDEMLPRQMIHPVPYALNLRPRNSFIFIPGYAMVKEKDTDGITWNMARNGSATVTASAVGDYSIFFPIGIPSFLHGQAQRIEEIIIYYKCSAGAPNFISRTVLAKRTGATTHINLVNDATARIGEAEDSAYTIDVTSPDRVLTAAQGMVGLYLGLHFGDLFNPINIGGIRIKFIDNY